MQMNSSEKTRRKLDNVSGDDVQKFWELHGKIGTTAV